MQRELSDTAHHLLSFEGTIPDLQSLRKERCSGGAGQPVQRMLGLLQRGSQQLDRLVEHRILAGRGALGHLDDEVWR